MSEPLHEDYLGIKRKIAPNDLKSFEESGFSLEEKMDGWWCCFEVGTGMVRNKLWTRHGNSITSTILEELDLELSKGDRLIGEWMPYTEELWVHDVVQFNGNDLRTRTHDWRRHQLEVLFDYRDLCSLKLIPQYTNAFAAVYEGIILEGGEGVVLKHRESVYHSKLKSQKTGMWLKCKPEYQPKPASNSNICYATDINNFTIGSGGS
jgi:ATP-dependent DNA ligase